MLESIPESQEDIELAAKNRKRKKSNQRNKNLEIIPEEVDDIFEQEQQEFNEAFDSISVAKKHENHPVTNGFFASPAHFSPQPSTSYANSVTTSVSVKSRNTIGGRNKSRPK